jgi:hypothetical protein
MGRRAIHIRLWWVKPEDMRWTDNIKTDLTEIGKGVGWIHLTQDRAQLAVSCKHGNEPPCSIKCGEFCDYVKNC